MGFCDACTWAWSPPHLPPALLSGLSCLEWGVPGRGVGSGEGSRARISLSSCQPPSRPARSGRPLLRGCVSCTGGVWEGKDWAGPAGACRRGLSGGWAGLTGPQQGQCPQVFWLQVGSAGTGSEHKSQLWGRCLRWTPAHIWLANPFACHVVSGQLLPPPAGEQCPGPQCLRPDAETG